MEIVAIVGVGLIGGSFALALRKAGFGGRIVGVSSAPALREALDLGIIQEGLPLEQAIPSADLVYLSQPIRRIIRTLGEISELLRPRCLVTDAGSTKQAIVAEASRKIRGAQFLGGHPMAGKERTGVAESDADLFNGRTYLLTPGQPEELDTDCAREFTGWVRRIGATPVIFSPREHDRVVSYTSHLAQMASTALAATVYEVIEGNDWRGAAGPGLNDTTRLAMSPYDIWSDILATNTQFIAEALDAYIKKLTVLRSHLTTDQMRLEFDAAANFARSLRRQS